MLRGRLADAVAGSDTGSAADSEFRVITSGLSLAEARFTRNRGANLAAMRQTDVIALFEYNYWANWTVLAAVAKASPEQFTARKTVTWRNLRGTLVHTLDVELAAASSGRAEGNLGRRAGGQEVRDRRAARSVLAN